MEIWTSNLIRRDACQLLLKYVHLDYFEDFEVYGNRQLFQTYCPIMSPHNSYDHGGVLAVGVGDPTGMYKIMGQWSAWLVVSFSPDPLCTSGWRIAIQCHDHRFKCHIVAFGFSKYSSFNSFSFFYDFLFSVISSLSAKGISNLAGVLSSYPFLVISNISSWLLNCNLYENKN